MSKKKDWLLEVLERASKQVSKWSDAKRAAWEQRSGHSLPPRSIGEEQMEKLKVHKNDAEGVQLEWHGVLFTLQVNQHHGISGSIAEQKDGKIALLTFHGENPRNLMPLALHEETLKDNQGDKHG